MTKYKLKPSIQLQEEYKQAPINNMNEWMLLEGIILLSEADIASAQSASGSTALLTLFRFSLYPILAYLSGLAHLLVFPHAKYLAAVLLQGYQSCPQEDRFPFSSPHTRHLSTCQKSACPDSLCWGFGFDYTSRMVSFMTSGFCEPSWILSSVQPFTSFYPTFDNL